MAYFIWIYEEEKLINIPYEQKGGKDTEAHPHATYDSKVNGFFG